MENAAVYWAGKGVSALLGGNTSDRSPSGGCVNMERKNTPSGSSNIALFAKSGFILRFKRPKGNFGRCEEFQSDAETQQGEL